MRSDAASPRVGIFVREFPSPSETFIVSKVLGLLDAGIDVRIFAISPSPHWGRFAALAGRNDVRQRITYLLPLSPRTLLTRGLPRFMTVLVTRPIQVLRLVTHSWRTRRENTLGFALAVYWRASLAGQTMDLLHIEFDIQALGIADLRDYLRCRVLVSSRGAFQRSTVHRRFPHGFAYICRYADAFHFISEHLRLNAIRLGLPASMRTVLIEPAIDLRVFPVVGKRQPRAPDEPLRILSVGRLSWEKGYEYALDAVALLVERGLVLEYTILGEGDYREAIVFAARQHGLLQRGIVRLLGAVPREEVVDHYRHAHVLLHAAVDEGFCNSVLEAQAMQLPVVASDAGGLPENLADGITGFIVPRRDVRAMADRMWQLAHDPVLYEKLSAAGRERVAERFELGRQIAGFVALYRELSQYFIARQQ